MLRAIDRLSEWLGPRLQRLGACGQAGAIAGMLAGGILVLLDAIEGGLVLDGTAALQSWVVLAAFCWVALLFIFVVFVRWRFGSVVIPTFVNAVLVTGLTVLVCYLTGAYGLGFFIGLLIGMLVGLLLCSLYRRVAER